MIFRLVPAIVLAVTACQAPPKPTSADVAARNDCRHIVEQQYRAQNRAELTRRDERDQPFAGTYNASIPSRGLGAEFGQEQALSNCLRAVGDRNNQVAPGIGPNFSPAAIGTGTSSLRP